MRSILGVNLLIEACKACIILNGVEVGMGGIRGGKVDRIIKIAQLVNQYGSKLNI